MGNYLTKKNSRNKILQLSKNNNIINNNNDNLTIQNHKKTIKDKKLEFKLSIPAFPHSSLYNQFLTNQTINITLSNCFNNNSTINEKKDKIEGVKPIHRRYASINYPLNNNTSNNNNNINNINYSSRLKSSNSKMKKKIRLC